MFGKFAWAVAEWAGSAVSFCVACCIVIGWAVCGPYFHYSDTWQLAINTGTTIVTFLMVFLLQHTQARDTLAIQLKLDELIRSTTNADNSLMDLEQLSEEELARLRAAFAAMADREKGKA